MVYRLYSIFDRLAEECGPIFCAPNEAVALRNYRQVIKDVPDKSEYLLVDLGEFHTQEMRVNGRDKAEVIIDPLVKEGN